MIPNPTPDGRLPTGCRHATQIMNAALHHDQQPVVFATGCRGVPMGYPGSMTTVPSGRTGLDHHRADSNSNTTTGIPGVAAVVIIPGGVAVAVTAATGGVAAMLIVSTGVISVRRTAAVMSVASRRGVREGCRAERKDCGKEEGFHVHWYAGCWFGLRCAVQFRWRHLPGGSGRRYCDFAGHFFIHPMVKLFPVRDRCASRRHTVLSPQKAWGISLISATETRESSPCSPRTLPHCFA